MCTHEENQTRSPQVENIQGGQKEKSDGRYEQIRVNG